MIYIQRKAVFGMQLTGVYRVEALESTDHSSVWIAHSQCRMSGSEFTTLNVTVFINECCMMVPTL